jgi:hypothetical protein
MKDEQFLKPLDFNIFVQNQCCCGKMLQACKTTYIYGIPQSLYVYCGNRKAETDDSIGETE